MAAMAPRPHPPRSRGPSLVAALVAAALLTSLSAAGAAAQSVLEAGAVARKLALPEDVPLAGYSERRGMPDVLGQYEHAHYFPPRQGQHAGEEIRAKALVLKLGSQRFAFVSLDLVGVDRRLRKRIVEALAPAGFGRDDVLISATHTHSGPGALSANHFFEFLATDRIHRRMRKEFVAQVVALVGAANNALTPAHLFATEFDGQALHKNRNGPAPDDDHVLSLLAVGESASGPPWIGALVNFGVHGTAHDETNNALSADFPGKLERAFATAMGASDPGSFPVLFLNGAEGDQAPRPAADVTGFATAAFGGWLALGPAPLTVTPWEMRSCSVRLGRPFLYLRSQLKPLHSLWPFSRLGIELETYFPRRVQIRSLSLAGLRFMTFPGEPVSKLGRELRQKAAQLGIQRAWILGLTDDHLGYFVSGSQWKEASYDSFGAVYGPSGARRLVNGHVCLLRPGGSCP